MPVVKGGVWSNIEDEILKASVSKYGLNQWARVSSLLARKTAKQCKARWSEWLDPSIRKIEWSKEEDNKLMHLAKLMPTQWRSIAPIIGRTATQCLERYGKLVDEEEARDKDLALVGPDGGENKAPSADDVRRLRPGELDPDPEAKPARPDTVDLDEDEKEMLSEARARLANTQGKKAKRKARERQLEESRRLAQLQKRRELKSAGINVKVTTRKPGTMDYNADIPFEKAPAPGFYDTNDELARNETQRETFDPRQQNISSKRKQDLEDEEENRKRRKNENKTEQPSASQAAIRAGQMQKMREAERSSKRTALNLPAPQLRDHEYDDVLKTGNAADRSAKKAASSDNDATRGLISNYSGIIDSTPLRTPRAPEAEDQLANEIRNARARTQTQSALLGGENPELVEGSATTGFTGATPSQQQQATPNPLAEQYRQAANGQVGTGATPMRTPRDGFRLNSQTPVQAPGQTPREVKVAREAARNTLRGKLASLPKPKDLDFEFEIPEEQPDAMQGIESTQTEDARIRDAREAELQAAQQQAEFKRQTQVVQRGLPRPRLVDVEELTREAQALDDPAKRMMAEETVQLVAHDAQKFGGASVTGDVKKLDTFTDQALDRARMEIALELSTSPAKPEEDFTLPMIHTVDDPAYEHHLPRFFKKTMERITETAAACNVVEKRLMKLHGGYHARNKMIREKTREAQEALEETRIQLETKRLAKIDEDAEMASRLSKLRDEVQGVMGRERRAQEAYKAAKDELDELRAASAAKG